MYRYVHSRKFYLFCRFLQGIEDGLVDQLNNQKKYLMVKVNIPYYYQHENAYPRVGAPA